MPSPISRGYAAAANQDFAVRRQFDFAPRQNFSNRSFAQAKRMIHADDGSRFRQPIALDGGVSQASPELFGHAIERGPSGNECPELPSKLAMHSPEDPPAVEEMLSLRRLKSPPEIFEPAFIFQIALDLLLQRLQHARHRHQHRHSLAPDGANDFARLERILENHRAAHQLRQKYSQKLPEHVAQGQQVQEANGMDQAFILQIFLDFCFQRRDVARARCRA